ncbi:polycystin-2-like [Penaeus vannamei]|uniref:polycystin-2-like n=1 Tax=Penaeus vannamei TaxID=6689 RepID=UPI00387F5552
MNMPSRTAMENTVNQKMRGMIKRCSGFSNVFKEDDEAYCAHWKPPTNLTKDSPDCKIPEFNHTSGLDLSTLPTVGFLDVYGPGGYVVHLNGSSRSLRERLTFLQSRGWIDRLTRYVVVEFASYNAQVNLFGLSHIMAEFTPGGGVTPSFRFTGIRLLPHHDSFGLFVMVCEASFVAFIVYYTFREFRQLCRNKVEYFKCYWSYAEIAIIVTSYATIAVYVARHFATESVVEVFNLTHGNGYVNLQYAASLDELYSYLVSFIVFVSTLKFIKLLRFNKRMGVLTATLRQCWDDLSGFLIAFIICFCSFTGMFYLLLNSQLENFHNFVISVETCFSMMLGK